jgi:tetratricopeptide (TPR) repeat protein
LIKAMYGLVLSYSSLQDYSKAIAELQNIRRLQPDNPEIYYNISCMYAKQNRPGESVAWLKQSIDKGFHDWDLLKKDPDLANIRNTAFVNELIKNH